VFLEAGNRLARHGTIAEADDVFYLVPDEIAEGISNGAKFTTVVANRKTEMERDSQIPAPPMIGTDYGPPPDNPVGRAIGRFFGGPPPESDVASGLVRGNPGSAGTVTGTARVIANVRDAERLGHGEILVTATTAPPWTPLFATAGGIVTDTGGPLSHCAIVAREYQLPAVVGTGFATQVIKDGQTIEVNGNLSEVRIIS
jgi:pyruvate,water dikinase